MAEPHLTRQAALDDFARARDELLGAYVDVPDAALHYLPEGDDYALGGLIVHIANAMEHYVNVLAQMRAEGFGPMQAAEGSGETAEMLAALKHGYAGAERDRHWSRLNQTHEALVREMQAVSESDFSRAAPVTFSGSTEPFPTSPAMIMGWMIDHYRDHVGQVHEMLEGWEKSTRG